jgi:hypothetical protein
MQPYVKKIESSAPSHLKVIRLDIEQSSNQKLVSLYRVRSYPKYLLFNPEGKVVYTMTQSFHPGVLASQVLRLSKATPELPPTQLERLNTQAVAGRPFILLLIDGPEKLSEDQLQGLQKQWPDRVALIHKSRDLPETRQWANHHKLTHGPSAILYQSGDNRPLFVMSGDEILKGELAQKIDLFLNCH